MFVGPFGRSPGRTKFAEPSNDRAVRLSSAGAEATIHFLCPFLVCAFGEQERPTALVALPLVWSSRSLERKKPSSLPRLHPSPERRQPSTSHRITSQGCRKTLSGTSSPWLASINFT